MTRIALPTSLLTGPAVEAQFAAAKAAGADGIELHVDAAFYDRLPDIATALRNTGLEAAALNVGHTRLVHPDFAERDAALAGMRQALAAAADIGAHGVVFYGHYAPEPVLPDLRPYKSAQELEAELLITQLRATLTDLAYAMGARLLLSHADSTCSSLLTRPEHASIVRAKLNDHPYLDVAVDLAHVDAERLEDTACWPSGVRYVRVCDTGGTLPGAGARDWTRWGAAMRASGYDGWLTITGGNAAGAETLAEAVAVMRRACA